MRLGVSAWPAGQQSRRLAGSHVLVGARQWWTSRLQRFFIQADNSRLPNSLSLSFFLSGILPGVFCPFQFFLNFPQVQMVLFFLVSLSREELRCGWGRKWFEFIWGYGLCRVICIKIDINSHELHTAWMVTKLHD